MKSLKQTKENNMKKQTITYKLETNVFTDPVVITTTKGMTGIIFGIAEAIADHYQVDDKPVAKWNAKDKKDLLSLSINGIDQDDDDFTLTMTKQN